VQVIGSVALLVLGFVTLAAPADVALVAAPVAPSQLWRCSIAARRKTIVGGYGRLCRVKDRARCLRCPYAAVEIRHLSAKFSK